VAVQLGVLHHVRLRRRPQAANRGPRRSRMRPFILDDHRG
jgi:hypothetical protein